MCNFIITDEFQYLAQFFFNIILVNEFDAKN